MEDVITEAAPPSRFLEEDLNIFTPPSPPLPSPFFLFSHPHSDEPLKPKLLIVAISAPSLALFHNLPSESLVASLILPELPLSLPDSAPSLHSLSPSTLLLSLPRPLSPHRAHAVASLLLGNRIQPQSVLVLDSVNPANHRARLSADEPLAFKLETSAERNAPDDEKFLDGLQYYPSGSVIDGLAAAILARCQIFNVKASLCVTWPPFDSSVVSLVRDLLRSRALRGFDFRLSDDEVLKFGRSKDRFSQSELYI